MCVVSNWVATASEPSAWAGAWCCAFPAAAIAWRHSSTSFKELALKLNVLVVSPTALVPSFAWTVNLNFPESFVWTSLTMASGRYTAKSGAGCWTRSISSWW